MAEKRQNSEAPKKIVPIWFVLLVFLLLGFALFGNRGFLKVFKAYQQKTELEQKISELEKNNIELREEIDALRNDLKAIENIARRELGMVRPDEQVYQFQSKEQRSAPEFPSGESRQQFDGKADKARVDTRPDEG